MATALVAGRVDESVKSRADLFIERAGMTSSDVIRIVWGNIAQTGEMPCPVERQDGNELLSRMRSLRKTTPRSEFLATLTPDGLKKELENRG